jgi:hypothetical protein
MNQSLVTVFGKRFAAYTLQALFKAAMVVASGVSRFW